MFFPGELEVIRKISHVKWLHVSFCSSLRSLEGISHLPITLSFLLFFLLSAILFLLPTHKHSSPFPWRMPVLLVDICGYRGASSSVCGGGWGDWRSRTRKLKERHNGRARVKMMLKFLQLSQGHLNDIR